MCGVHVSMCVGMSDLRCSPSTINFYLSHQRRSLNPTHYLNVYTINLDSELAPWFHHLWFLSVGL